MEMLEEMLLKGTTVNAYSTPIVWLETPNGADCWLGKLVGAGVAPQVSGCHYSIPLSPSQHAICDSVVPRVKYWLQLFRSSVRRPSPASNGCTRRYISSGWRAEATNRWLISPSMLATPQWQRSLRCCSPTARSSCARASAFRSRTCRYQADPTRR